MNKAMKIEERKKGEKLYKLIIIPCAFMSQTIMLRELPHDLCVIVTFSFVEVLFICCFALRLIFFSPHLNDFSVSLAF